MRKLIIALILIVIGAKPLTAEETLPDDPVTFYKDNPVILPVPREMLSLNKQLPLSNGVIAVTSEKTEQVKIGVNLINKKLSMIPETKIVVEFSENTAADKLNIIFAEVKDLNNASVKNFITENKDTKIPEISQGYSITFGNNNVLVLGSDRFGLLYGCITLKQMISFKDNSPYLSALNINDWPTFKYRLLSTLKSGHVKDPSEKAKICKQIIDSSLLQKINVIDIYHRLYEPSHGQQEVFDQVPEKDYKKFNWLKDVITYGKKRGITFMIYTGAAIAYDKDVNTDPRLKNMMRIHNRIYTWSEDDLIEKHVSNVANFCNYLGIKIIAWHYADTVNENWVNRGPLDRKKFGNNRPAADASLTNVIYNTMKNINSEMIMCPCYHPYTGVYLKHEYYRDFCKTLAKSIPDDVRIVFREYQTDAFQTMSRAYNDRPLLVYYQNVGIAKGDGLVFPMVDTAPRFAKNFFNGNRGSIFMLNGIFRQNDMNQTLYCQYTWNTESPGAEDNYRWADTTSIFNGSGNPDFFNKVLYPVCIRYFGEIAASQMLNIFKLGIHNSFIINPFAVKTHREKISQYDWKKIPPTDWNNLLKKQSEKILIAEQIADTLVAQPEIFKTAAQKKNFIKYFREIKALKYIVKISTSRWSVNKLANAGKKQEAEKELDNAVRLVNEAAEKLPQELSAGKDFGNTRNSVRFEMMFPKPRSRTLTIPDTFTGYIDVLAETRKNLDKLSKADLGTPMSDQDLKKAKNKKWHITKTMQEINIDGKLNEAVWKKSDKRPFIKILARKKSVKYIYPTARGNAKAAWDKNNLYLALEFDEEDIDSLLGTTGRRDKNDIFAEDLFEVFIQPALCKEYAHLACNISGRKRDGATETNPIGIQTNLQWNPDWQAGVNIDIATAKWYVEIKIPFSEFTEKYFGKIDSPPANGWKINIGRSRRNAGWSAVIPCKSFHQKEDYLELIFTQDK
ncbi:MAG: glycoside hydrolase family 20 zincin-like fold domain-containing protein [Planctomycetota bacterium]|jgi:hypothetical protein